MFYIIKTITESVVNEILVKAIKQFAKQEKQDNPKHRQEYNMPRKDKYRLIRESDPNEYLEFEVDSNIEDPCSVALEQLGWILVVAKNEESH